MIADAEFTAPPVVTDFLLAPVMESETGITLSYNDKVDRLYLWLKSHPNNFELGAIHTITPGLYSREATAPADSMLISKTHLHEHQFVMTKGVIYMIDDALNAKRYVAPCRGVTKAGTRRVVYVEEEATFITFHATKETDLAKIEAELYAEDRLLISDNPDHQDFMAMAKDVGCDTEQIRIESHNPYNQIPMPEGEGLKMEVKDSPIEGKGVFATRDILDGEMIAPAAILNKRTPAGRYTNHSAKPNAILTLDANGTVYLVASTYIPASTEITLDYRQARSVALRTAQLYNN